MLSLRKSDSFFAIEDDTRLFSILNAIIFLFVRFKTVVRIDGVYGSRFRTTLRRENATCSLATEAMTRWHRIVNASQELLLQLLDHEAALASTL